MDAAVKAQIEQDPEVRAAFEKMLTTGISAHHAEHVLGGLLAELIWGSSQSSEGTASKAKARYDHAIQRLCRDSQFRKKMTRRFGDTRRLNRTTDECLFPDLPIFCTARHANNPPRRVAFVGEPSYVTVREEFIQIAGGKAVPLAVAQT